MLTPDQLKQAVHRPGITKTDIALLSVAAGGGKGVPTSKVRDHATSAGVRGAKNLNFSGHLSAAEDKVFKTPDGWELTEKGRQHVATISASAISVSAAATEAQELRALLPKLTDADVRTFVSEAVVCVEQSLFRAAVVLSWIGAVAVLYEHVLKRCLKRFNNEALKRDPKWKTAKTRDDLARMKEYDFLQILEKLSVVGKNTKHELEQCLKLRNACGHPSSLQVGHHKVAAHLETLMLNVFAKFT